MTRDDIIRLVEQRQQIEPPPLLDALKEGELCWMLGSRDVLWIVEQAVAAEREACAKACDEYSADRWAAYKGRPPYKPMLPARKRFIQGQCVGADDCAAAIRARGET